MASWLLLGLLAYTFFSISTAIDKYVMHERYYPFLVNTVKMLLDCFVLVLIGTFFFTLTLPPLEQLWPILLGVLYGASGVYYFKALQEGDITEVIPYQLGSRILLLFIVSLYLFNETATPLNLFGILLTLVGVWLVLSPQGLPRWNRAVLLISISLFFNVLFNLLAKYLVAGIEPIMLAVMMYAVSALVLAGYLLLRKPLWKAAERTLGLSGLRHIGISALFGSVGTLLLLSALKVGAASKVYPLTALETVLLFLIGILFMKEKWAWHRAFGVLAVGIGIIFIAG